MKNKATHLHASGKQPYAIIIFDKSGIIYSNPIFDKLHTLFDKAFDRKFEQLLSILISEFNDSGKATARKTIQLIPARKKIDTTVYKINNHQTGDFSLLLMAAQDRDVGEFPFYNPGQTVNFDNAPKMQLSSVFSQLVGEDIHFKAVLLKAQKAAQSDYPILIKGESGTGKEILAKTIHHASRRRNKKFVDINCAAIPDQLIDSELFGYEKGAFTGALPSGRHGLFIEANQGTLFLDEIADASLPTQAKLLRVLNEGHFKRVGSMKNIAVNVRIISATNKDLPEMIEKKHFRQDLIYRLNTITINLPPLRDRPVDIPLLSTFFLDRHAQKKNKNLKFSANCIEELASYHWPGNVRELKGVIDYMVTMATGSTIGRNHLPDFLIPSRDIQDVNPKSANHGFIDENETNLLSKAVQSIEKKIIQDALKFAKNRSAAIKLLGTSRRTFYSKLKKYNII